MSKENYFEKALNWTKNKPIKSLRAKFGEYDNPKIFRNAKTGENVQADMSFIHKSGGKSFTDIALKTDEPRKLATRWKLLSLMASLKKGKLHLLVPRGHKKFTQTIIADHSISAVLHSI